MLCGQSPNVYVAIAQAAVIPASAAGMPAFAIAAALYVFTGLLIAWAGGALERKVRILR